MNWQTRGWKVIFKVFKGFQGFSKVFEVFKGFKRFSKVFKGFRGFSKVFEVVKGNQELAHSRAGQASLSETHFAGTCTWLVRIGWWGFTFIPLLSINRRNKQTNIESGDFETGRTKISFKGISLISPWCNISPVYGPATHTCKRGHLINGCSDVLCVIILQNNPHPTDLSTYTPPSFLQQHFIRSPLLWWW